MLFPTLSQQSGVNATRYTRDASPIIFNQPGTKYLISLQSFQVFATACWPALVAEWVKPLAVVHTGQGSLPVRVEPWLLPLRLIGLSAGVHAIGLFLDRHRGFTCVLFKMWQVAAAKSRDSCLVAVCAASGILILQAVRLAARWSSCCLLAHGRPMGPMGVYGLAAGGGPAYWAQPSDLSEAKQIWSWNWAQY